MYLKIMRNAFNKNKLISVLTVIFVALTSLLIALVFSVGINVLQSVDHLMTTARTPHFIQMHAGQVDAAKIKRFATAEKDQVAKYQVLPFLGVENSLILVNKQAVLGSFQDNGFSTQSPRFDYLLDSHDRPVRPQKGAVYVPTFYKNKIQRGDQITVGKVKLKVAGFLRDSQMNSSLASSKRFVVNQADYDQLAAYGKEEQLIEFRLKDLGQIDSFVASYEAQHMPANGPAITYPLVRMVNIVSDGIMLAVLFALGIITTIISLLCVRFTLLTKISDEYQEIETMKALGIPIKVIKKIYLTQYRLLTMGGIVAGLSFALSLSPFLARKMALYLGHAPIQWSGVFFSVGGVALLYLVVMGYVRWVLRRFKSIAPVQALQQGITSKQHVKKLRSKHLSANVALAWHDLKTRQKLYTTLFIIALAAAFMVVVPHNLQQTLASDQFVTYMGIGKSDIRIDNREALTNSASKRAFASDPAIAKSAVLTTRTYQLAGSKQMLKVELGNQQTFPLTYSKGRAPRKETEIALS